MKKFLCILISALLLISSLACAESVLSFQSAEETTEQKLERMIPVLDSLAHNMGIEGEVAYSAADPGFVWTQLQLMCSDWSMLDERLTVADGKITVPAQVLREYAAASFQGMDILPEQPAADAIPFAAAIYDAASDSYELTESEPELTCIVIERYAFLNEEDLAARVGLYVCGDDVRLGGLYVVMTANEAPEDSLDAPMFPYAVKDCRTRTVTSAISSLSRSRPPLWRPRQRPPRFPIPACPAAIPATRSRRSSAA